MPDTEHESGLYVIKTGTVEQAFAAHGYARPASIEAALRQIGGATGAAVRDAMAGLNVVVQMLPEGADPTSSYDSDATTLTFGIPAGRDGRDGIGAPEATALVQEAEQARAAAVDAQLASEEATRAAFAEPDEAMAQVVTDAATQTRAALDADFVRRSQTSGMMPWRIAHSQRGTTAARIVTLGSQEGQGAGARVARWQERLQGILRDGASGSTWLAAAPSDPSIPSAGLVASGNTSVSGGTSGWGGRALVLRGGSSATTPQMVMTGATIWYMQDNFFSTDAEVLVDGTKVADLPATGTYMPVKRTTVTTTLGNHTITVRAKGDSSLAFSLTAVHVHRDDQPPGVQVIDGSRAGTLLRDVPSTEWDRSHYPVLTALDPSLVIVYAGDVDWLNDATGFAEGLIAGIPAKIDALVARHHSLLLVLPPRPVPPEGAGANVTAARYAYVASMLRAVADAHPDRVAFLDATAHFPRLEQGGATSQGLFVETDRPRTLSPAGHQWLAETIASVLT